MSIFFLILFAVVLGDIGLWRIADQRVRGLDRRGLTRAAVNIFMASQVLCLVWMMVGRSVGIDARTTMPAYLLAVAFMWHLIVMPFTLLVLLIARLSSSIISLIRRARALKSKAEPSNPVRTEVADARADNVTPDPAFSLIAPSRRQFLATAAVSIPPLLAMGGAGWSMHQLSHFRVRPMTVAIPGLPIDLDGLRIAHVSDIHVGKFTHGRILRDVVNATNALRSDLVLFTGDLIDRALDDLPEGLDTLQKMQAKNGVYMIEGNHDLFEGRSTFEATCRASGIPLLLNDSTFLKIRGVDVQLLGLVWGRGKASPGGPRERGDDAITESMETLRPQLQPGAFPILMAHHPHAFDLAARAKIPLTLAGHTHGGQVMLTPNFGPGPLMYRYWSGLYRKGDSSLVVSNGVGNWFPLRINAPAEIVDITLRRA